MSRAMMDLVSSFAHSGRPTPQIEGSTVCWESVYSNEILVVVSVSTPVTVLLSVGIIPTGRMIDQI